MKPHPTSQIGRRTSLLALSLSLALLAALAVWCVLERSARSGTFSMLMLCISFLAFGFIAGFAFSGLLMTSANSDPDRAVEKKPIIPVEAKTPKSMALSHHVPNHRRRDYYDDSDWD